MGPTTAQSHGRSGFEWPWDAWRICGARRPRSARSVRHEIPAAMVNQNGQPDRRDPDWRCAVTSILRDVTRIEIWIWIPPTCVTRFRFPRNAASRGGETTQYLPVSQSGEQVDKMLDERMKLALSCLAERRRRYRKSRTADPFFYTSQRG